MNILVANDDGIQAKGIAKLTEARSLAGHDVYVIARMGSAAAYSHAISINKDVLFSEMEDYPFAKEAYMVDGTPADCVKLGTLFLKKRGIRTEAVYTGINHGANLGTDTMYSVRYPPRPRARFWACRLLRFQSSHMSRSILRQRVRQR